MPDHNKILTSVRGIYQYAETRDYLDLAESLTRNLLLLLNEGVLTGAKTANSNWVELEQDGEPHPVPLADNPESTCPTCGKSTTGSEGWSTGQCDDCYAADNTDSVKSSTVKTWSYSRLNRGGADVTLDLTFEGTDDEWAEHLAELTNQGIEPYNAKITGPVTALGTDFPATPESGELMDWWKNLFIPRPAVGDPSDNTDWG